MDRKGFFDSSADCKRVYCTRATLGHKRTELVQSAGGPGQRDCFGCKKGGHFSRRSRRGDVPGLLRLITDGSTQSDSLSRPSASLTSAPAGVVGARAGLLGPLPHLSSLAPITYGPNVVRNEFTLGEECELETMTGEKVKAQTDNPIPYQNEDAAAAVFGTDPSLCPCRRS